jgi:5-methylthioadenosine/S-adenosylhomocysteine deaminase
MRKRGSSSESGVSDSAISRRGLIKASAIVAASVAAPALPRTAEAAEGGVVRTGNTKPNGRILIKGATIITMDEKLGDIAKGDLLVEGKKIVAVGGDLKSAGAQVIDGANAILIPGFVDCHRHSWEGQLRRINPNAATLDAYSAATHQSFAKAYRPDDIYAGNLITALGCIDSGVTCVIDNSHNSRSGAHSDAAIKALFDSGIRGVHAAGPPQAGDWDHQLPQDLARLQKQYFSSADQLVTLRMFAGPVKEQWAYARSLGLRITMEFQGAAMGKIADQFAEEKLLGPDITFNHCGNLPESTWQNLKNAGVTINVCPRSDSQYGLGAGFPAFSRRSITA